MSGGLNDDCAFAKCWKPTGESDIFSVVVVEGLEDFLPSLLVKEPIVSLYVLLTRSDELGDLC
jgi:hypothetical protein